MKPHFVLILLMTSSVFGQVSLDSAYTSNSTEMLYDIFETWICHYPPITEKKLSQKYEFEKHAYELFEDFSIKEMSPKISEFKSSDSLTISNTYILLPNEITISIYDILFGRTTKNGDISKLLSRFKILDFSPRINFKNLKVIFFAEEIKRRLESFIQNQPIPFLYTFHRKSSSTLQEELRRRIFIKKYLHFVDDDELRHPWSIKPYYRFYVNFNKQFSEAEIIFAADSYSHTASYKLAKNKWVFIKSSQIWS